MKIVYLGDQEIDMIVGGVVQLMRPVLEVTGLRNFGPGLVTVAVGHPQAKQHFNRRRYNRFYLGRQFYSGLSTID